MLSGHWGIQCVLFLQHYYYGLLPRTSFCRLGTKTGSPLPLCRKHWLTKWSECKVRKTETKATRVTVRTTLCPWNTHTHIYLQTGGCVSGPCSWPQMCRGCHILWGRVSFPGWHFAISIKPYVNTTLYLILELFSTTSRVSPLMWWGKTQIVTSSNTTVLN